MASLINIKNVTVASGQTLSTSVRCEGANGEELIAIVTPDNCTLTLVEFLGSFDDETFKELHYTHAQYGVQINAGAIQVLEPHVFEAPSYIKIETAAPNTTQTIGLVIRSKHF